MGYYTNYELTCYEVKNDMRKHIMRKDPIYQEIGKALAPLFDREISEGENVDYEDFFLEEMKWYEHNEDMCALSEKFPNVLFQLSGWGEDNGDIWVEWYYRGKSERVNAEIVFRDPDWNQLGIEGEK